VIKRCWVWFVIWYWLKGCVTRKVTAGLAESNVSKLPTLWLKPKFHYADFATKSAKSTDLATNISTCRDGLCLQLL